MKWIKFSHIFFLTVLVLGGYVIYDLRSEKSSLEDKTLFPIFENSAASVSEIVLQTKEQKIVLKRTNGVWNLVEPVSDLAEEVAVQALLMQLYGNSGREVFSSGESAKVVNFAEPKLQLILNGQVSEKVLFANENAYDGSYFVKRNDGKVLVVDTSWSRVFDQSSSSLRSRKVIAKPEGVQKVDVEGPEKFTLISEGAKWVMVPSPGYQIDSLKVDHWLDEIQNLRANEFFGENPTASELKSLGLNPPMVTLSIQMAKGTELKVKMGSPLNSPSGDDTYIQTSLRETVYKLKSNSLGKVIVGKEFFRDGKSFFDFDVEKASEIVIDLNGVRTSIKRKDLNWTFANSQGSLEIINSDKLAGFFQRLKSLEAVDFIVGQSPAFLNPSSIKVLDTNSKVLLEMFVGSSYVGKRGFVQGVDLNYVRVSGQTVVLGLKSNELRELVTPDLLVR